MWHQLPGISSIFQSYWRSIHRANFRVASTFTPQPKLPFRHNFRPYSVYRLQWWSQPSRYDKTDFQKYSVVIGRLTYLLAELGFTAILSSSFRHLPSELAERNSTKTGHMIGNITGILKCMCYIWGIPSPRNRSPKTPFSAILQLNGNFNGIYLRNETSYT